MTLLMRDQENIEKGIQQGMKQGRKEGMLQAKKEATLGLYTTGISITQIAQALNVSADTIKEWLKESESQN